MKKSLKHRWILIAFCLVAFKSYSQDHSNINIDVSQYDSSEIQFLDTVETKLQAKIKDMVSDNYKGTSLQLYDINSIQGSEWAVPLTKTEIKMQIPDESFHQKYLTTTKYELSIKWDSSLSKAYIIGFSKLYLYYLYANLYHPSGAYLIPSYNKEQLGPYTAPLYEVPLAEYHKFLTNGEMERLYKIVQRALVNQATDISIPSNDSVSYRTIQFNKCDSLPQFNLRYWGFLFKGLLMSGEIHAYMDEGCKTQLTLTETKNNNLSHTDTFKDEKGNPAVIPYDCKVSSIVVAEKWNLDTATKGDFYYRNALCALRKIEAIGIVTDYVEYYPKGRQYVWVDNKPMWIKYDAIKTTSALNMGSRKLYREIIDADLYRKLKVDFRYFY